MLRFFSLLFCFAGVALANFDSNLRFGYGANLGWTNFRAGGLSGSLLPNQNLAFLEGYAYLSNCGWIYLGDGSPNNEFSYSNQDMARDFGVNHVGGGRLEGFAYCANLGWMVFEQSVGKPMFDLITGELEGLVYSANCGWINLGSDRLFIEQLSQGADSDSDGIPDFWENEQTILFGGVAELSSLGAGDFDGDGKSDYEEYLADTNPFDQNSFLKILDFDVFSQEINLITIAWTSSEDRIYELEFSPNLLVPFSPLPSFSPLVGSAETSTMSFNRQIEEREFYQVRAKLPLNE